MDLPVATSHHRTRPPLIGILVLAAAVVLLSLLPLGALRQVPGYDILIHLRWADQFYTALQEGKWLPRWVPASFNGLGDPTFFYYQPLFYYVSSVFRTLGFAPQRALMLAATVPYVVLAAIVYTAILKRHTHDWALAGAALVVASPPLLFVTTHMGFLPWSLGIPLSVLVVMESLRPQPRPVRLAILLGLTCLSHLLSAEMALLCAGVSRLVLYVRLRPQLPQLTIETHWIAGVAVGLALAAFFIYPAVTQMHLINPDGWTKGQTYHWKAAMLFPTFTRVLYGSRWLAFQWPIPLIVLGMALFVVVGQRRRAGPRGDAWRLAVGALAALALGSELAYPLYALLGPMQTLQFPFRFLPLAAILAGIAFVLHLCEGGWRDAARPMRILAVLLALGYAAQSLYVEWDVYRYGKPLPSRDKYMAGRFGQPEYLVAAHGPDWEAYIKNGKLAGECARLQISCDEPAPRLTHAYSAVIDTPRAVTLRLPMFAFPAWGLSVDGAPQALRPDPDTGLVLVDLAPGRHAVGLRWVDLPAERTGRVITLIALIALAALLFLQRRAARRRGRPGNRGVADAMATGAPLTADAGDER